ncbi:hypothetical protein RB195_013330 [Necator americanus]|uniref:Uncharacterized protein n=1 Tax=Necator americanus TaxID=51031 RepID=A0ABR1DV04_NECAM
MRGTKVQHSIRSSPLSRKIFLYAQRRKPQDSRNEVPEPSGLQILRVAIRLSRKYHNIDDEHDRLVIRLHNFTRKVKSFKTTSRCSSPKIPELVSPRGAVRVVGKHFRAWKGFAEGDEGRRKGKGRSCKVGKKHSV